MPVFNLSSFRRKFALDANQLRAIFLSILLQEVGIHQARGVILGRVINGPPKGLVSRKQSNHSNPVRSSKLNMRLKFCTATPLAPRTKLSSAASTSTFPRTTFTHTSRKLVPVVSFVASGLVRTRTNGLSSKYPRYSSTNSDSF